MSRFFMLLLCACTCAGCVDAAAQDFLSALSLLPVSDQIAAGSVLDREPYSVRVKLIENGDSVKLVANVCAVAKAKAYPIKRVRVYSYTEADLATPTAKPVLDKACAES